MSFDITKTSIYDAVFRLPWLEKHEPTIGYKERTIRFIGCACEGKKRQRIEILPVSLSAMSAYYRQNPE